jgi:mannitol-specific phosphotransferase system IIBC component
VDLGVLSLLAFFVVVVVVVVVKTMMGSSVASVFSSSLLLLALLSVVQAEVLFDSNLTTGRNTLSGMRFDLRW